MKSLKPILILQLFIVSNFFAKAQHASLHLSPEWEQCSFQLDPSLTQNSWHKFTREAGQVSYYRPLTDAKPLGIGKVDLSVTQWKTRINEHDDAWNNTFVHPDSTHWLVDGPRLPIMGLSLRTGISKKMDAGIYWTTNPQANYSILGAQLQYSILDQKEKGWAASTRFTFNTIYGPRDLTFNSYGIDLVGSKRIGLYKKSVSLTPYAVFSGILAHAHERTDAVELKDENVVSLQGALGVVGQISWFRIAAEYNFAKAGTLSYRIGAVMNVTRGK